jgi:hypothetical protein
MYIMPEILGNPGHPDAGIFLASNHRGHLLRFETGDPVLNFNDKDECRVFSGRYWGFSVGAIRLCVANTAENEVQARLVKCPAAQASAQTCLNTTSWHVNPGWNLKMAASFRVASIAYSRLNGTILWHSFNSSHPATPHPILATDIIKSYDTLLFDTTTYLRDENASRTPFSGSSFATFLWSMVPETTASNVKNPEAASTWFSALQSLLAMPLYYCQSGMMRRLIPAGHLGGAVDSGVDRFLSQAPERETQVTFAYQRFETAADHGTLVAYIVVSGVAVLFCIVVQLGIALLVVRQRKRSREKRGAYRGEGASGPSMPDLSSFGVLDLLMHCAVESQRDGVVVYQGHPKFATRSKEDDSPMRWLSDLGIRWAGTGSKPAQEAAELQSITWVNESCNGNDDTPVSGHNGLAYELPSPSMPSLVEAPVTPVSPLSRQTASFSMPRPAHYARHVR